MNSMDQTRYQQSLSKPLFLKHPYQPQDTTLLKENYQSISYYETVRKDVQNMLMREVPTAAEDHNQLTTAIQEIQWDLNESCQSGFTEGIVQTPNICHHIHPSQHQQAYNASHNQPSPINTPQINHTGSLALSKQFDWNQIIVKSSSLPAKKDNYFELAGGFNRYLLPPQATNEAITLPPKRYPYIFVANSLQLLTLYLAFSLQQPMLWILLGGIYLAYLLISFGSSIAHNLFSLRTNQRLSSSVSSLKQHRGYFTFHIQCYHFNKNETSPQQQQKSTPLQKVITYKLSSVFPVSSCIDHTACLSRDKISTSFTQIKAVQHFSFAKKESQIKFIAAFNEFVESNLKDTYQHYSYKFEVEQGKEINGMYQLDGVAVVLKWLFPLFTVLALCFPLSVLIECQTTRLQAKIIKKISI